MSKPTQSGQQSKISIWLDDSSPDILKQFRCVVCGKVVFEYYNNVNIIVPGDNGKQKGSIVIQCSGRIPLTKNTNERVTFKDGRAYVVKENVWHEIDPFNVYTADCKTKYWVR